MNHNLQPNQADIVNLLSAATAPGRARKAALDSITGVSVTPASKVDFQSSGELLIIGPAPYARSILSDIDGQLSCSILAIADARQTSTPGEATIDQHVLDDGRSIPIIEIPVAAMSGHFGRFNVEVLIQGKQESLARLMQKPQPYFDLVLDLGREPVLRQERLPEGYFAPRDSTELQAAVDALPGLIGAFEKPRYVEYAEDRCVHGERGITGCSRCIDVCSSSAITSVGERIEVDPYLCQGAGCCASICPSGALTYTYPHPEDFSARVRALLRAYYEHAEIPPVLILHNAEDGMRQIFRIASALPEQVIPVEVEDIGAIGWELWLTALCYGAGAVVFLTATTASATETAILRQQLGYTHQVLSGLGYALPAVYIVADEDDALHQFLSALSPQPLPARATFSPQADKRTLFRLVLDHLYDHAPSPVDSVDLSRGAPFGEVQVNGDACTLCMACTSVCPLGALLPGDDSPQLRFNEWNCVQCGLCETACPEDAISYRPRVLCNPEQRRKVRILYEEEPFHCIECGKPFATQSIIARMQEQLKNHRMFKDDGIRRLQMCEDCRVKDLFNDGGDRVN